MFSPTTGASHACARVARFLLVTGMQGVCPDILPSSVQPRPGAT